MYVLSRFEVLQGKHCAEPLLLGKQCNGKVLSLCANRISNLICKSVMVYKKSLLQDSP